MALCTNAHARTRTLLEVRRVVVTIDAEGITDLRDLGQRVPPGESEGEGEGERWMRVVVVRVRGG